MAYNTPDEHSWKPWKEQRRYFRTSWKRILEGKTEGRKERAFSLSCRTVHPPKHSLFRVYRRASSSSVQDVDQGSLARSTEPCLHACAMYCTSEGRQWRRSAFPGVGSGLIFY